MGDGQNVDGSSRERKKMDERNTRRQRRALRGYLVLKGRVQAWTDHRGSDLGSCDDDLDR